MLSRMSRDIDIVAPEVARYLEGFRAAPEPVLARLEAEAAAERVPIIAKAGAAYLDLAVRQTKPERMLEIGTAIGYSAIVLARALPSWGNLETIELDPKTAERAEANIAEAGLRSKVKVHVGPALEVLKRLENRYDLVFIDAAKEEYLAYLTASLALMPKGATVIVDNLLWSGRTALAAQGAPASDEQTPHLVEFNKHFMSHPQLRAVILPVGDGLGVGVKL